MTAVAGAVIDGLAEKGRVLLRRATFVSMTDGMAVVDVGGSQFPVEFATGMIPAAGDPVHLLVADGRTVLLGPTQPKPGFGVVETSSGSQVRVRTTAGTFRMPAVGAALPTSGETVAIAWSEGPVCLGALFATPPAVPAPTPAPAEPVIRSVEFRAGDTGSTDRNAARWWTDQPWASNSTYGAFFYGSQIKDTIPANATFVSLEFYVSYQQRQGDPPRFALHNAASKGGLPSFGAYTTWAPGGGWQTPPNAADWFNALKAGGDRWGVGLDQGGFNKFSSRTQDAQSGALRITWKA